MKDALVNGKEDEKRWLAKGQMMDDDYVGILVVRLEGRKPTDSFLK